eukprot:TRINITY_DN47343_c0_g1_i1.p1 TRINITY_DN47343_c0_g1~~TRINITY_DN47343_c0_g1_i1.p1  ORF type:complete len:842 (-),score=118.31 TRINITY_DN47343_c0_g1_i1:4-2529(-)
MQDAKATADAAVKVIKSHQHPLAYFHFLREDGNRIRLQTTQGQAGSLDEAVRICRLVYMRLAEEPDWTKEEAKAYRDELVKGALQSGSIKQEVQEETKEVKAEQKKVKRVQKAVKKEIKKEPEEDDDDDKPLASLRRPSLDDDDKPLAELRRCKSATTSSSMELRQPCSKNVFLSSAMPWEVSVAGMKLSARPCKFPKTGTLGWTLTEDIEMPTELPGRPKLQCRLNIQGTLFNSRDWPNEPGDQAVGSSSGSGEKPGKAGKERQQAPAAVTQLLAQENWKDQWMVAGHVKIDVQHWGELILMPKVLTKTLGWKTWRSKGFPARKAAKNRLLGFGGIPVDGVPSPFDAPCQIHVWVHVRGSKQWIFDAQEIDTQAEAVDAAAASDVEPEDLAEQADAFAAVLEQMPPDPELEQVEDNHNVDAIDENMADLEDEASAMVGEAASLEEEVAHPAEAAAGENQVAIQRPQYRPLRLAPRRETFARTTLHTQQAERKFELIRQWHQWFKSMNADTFADTVREQPDLLRRYTEEALRLDAKDAPENRVVPKVFAMVNAHYSYLRDSGLVSSREPLRLVDLGCGVNESRFPELAQLIRQQGLHIEVTSVDAVALSEEVLPHNLGDLPSTWTGRFDIVVLSRSLWARDYTTVLAEARRILRPRSQTRKPALFVVEPFRRWFDRSQHWPGRNALPFSLQRAGFSIHWSACRGLETLPARDGAQPQHAIFQLLQCQPERDRCVVCMRDPARQFPKGFRLCLNHELKDVGKQPAPPQPSQKVKDPQASPPRRHRSRSPLRRHSRPMYSPADHRPRRPSRRRSRSRHRDPRHRRSDSRRGRRPVHDERRGYR